MMKKILFAVMLAVLAAGAHVRAAETISDVDKSNWAYDSIKMLVDKGYIALYDDHSFRGDQPVSRTVLAAALGKLIGQLESGEFKAGGADIKEIKKITDSLNSNVSDYDTRFKSMEQRLKDIESGKVVIQVDLSKATVEFRDKFDKMEQENLALKQQLAVLESKLDDETKKRKSSTNTLWIGVIGAIGAGLASN